MSAESDQADLARIAREISLRLPAFCALAVRSASDTDPSAISRAEAVLLHQQAVAERRQSFGLGRIAAHAALQTIDRDEGPILAGPNREPLWPSGVVGSISHTTDVGIALVAPSDRSDGVGVDIERQRWAPELADQVFRTEERDWLDGVAPVKRSATVLALFSAKECVFKAFFPGVGRFFGFHAASLVPVSSGFRGSLVEPIDDRYPKNRSFEIGCEWIGATVMTWLVLPSTHEEGESGQPTD